MFFDGLALAADITHLATGDLASRDGPIGSRVPRPDITIMPLHFLFDFLFFQAFVVIVFIEVSLQEGCDILRFPALITFDGIVSLGRMIIAVIAEWADHSVRASVVATDSTASGSNRASATLTTSFPDILTSGAHESLLH